MRLRVKFRYDARTGQVELFRVDDLRDGPPTAHHDARHDAATRDVASVVDPYASIQEFIDSTEREPAVAAPLPPAADATERKREDRVRPTGEREVR